MHVLCDTDFIARLIDRAEPELTGGRRERHARTIEIAQEEVILIICSHFHICNVAELESNLSV